jgi:hypothetical protein
MIRLPLLALAVLTLTGCNGSSADWNTAVAALTGEAQPQVFALANDVPSVEPVVETEPPHVPQCWWQRYATYLCDGVEVVPQPPNPYL